MGAEVAKWGDPHDGGGGEKAALGKAMGETLGGDEPPHH